MEGSIMPMHDWTRVDAGVFHDFHNTWIGALRNALNRDVLPPGYYAMSEQHAGKYVTDILTLNVEPKREEATPTGNSGGLAVALLPPKVRRTLSLSSTARALRKTLAIRHVSGNRLIALIEIVSPANKDRRDHVQEFVDKVEDALAHGIHVLVADIFPPGRHDLLGMHGVIWDQLGDKPDRPPRAERLTLASYVADIPVKVHLEHLAVGKAIPNMPLFLDPYTYVYVPLESTYDVAWQGTPRQIQVFLETSPRRRSKTS
jgi:hypothetical protein